jgi:hypothetical protein
MARAWLLLLPTGLLGGCQLLALNRQLQIAQHSQVLIPGSRDPRRASAPARFHLFADQRTGLARHGTGQRPSAAAVRQATGGTSAPVAAGGLYRQQPDDCRTNDGSVPLASELLPAAQDEAERLYLLEVDHTGILQSARSAARRCCDGSRIRCRSKAAQPSDRRSSQRSLDLVREAGDPAPGLHPG